MIKAIVTDVDGVIVGKKEGVNFPLPNTAVIERLKKLHKKGVPIVLCTAKSSHVIKKIVAQAELLNPHITDAGALIIDPLNNFFIKKAIFDKTLARDIVTQASHSDFYTEVYATDAYYLQKDHISDLTEKRFQILQKNPTIVDSLVEQINTIEVIKIKFFAHTKEEKKKIDKVLEQFKEKAHIIEGYHPFIFPIKDMSITPKGVSKKSATLEVLKYLEITQEEALGVGDTLGDWNFMSVCKYVGVVGDEDLELKNLAKTKGEGNYYFGSSVDNNGFLEILDYFNL